MNCFLSRVGIPMPGRIWLCACLAWSVWTWSLPTTVHMQVSMWSFQWSTELQREERAGHRDCRAQPRLVHWHAQQINTLVWLRTNASHEAGCRWHTCGQRGANESGFIPRLMENNYPFPSWDQPLSRLGLPFVYYQISYGDFPFQSRKDNPKTPHPSPLKTVLRFGGRNGEDEWVDTGDIFVTFNPCKNRSKYWFVNQQSHKSSLRTTRIYTLTYLQQSLSLLHAQFFEKVLDTKTWHGGHYYHGKVGPLGR